MKISTVQENTQKLSLIKLLDDDSELDITTFIECLKEFNQVLDIDDLKDVEKVVMCSDGIYIRWCDTNFYDQDDAVYMLKEMDGAFEAAINGYIDIEDRPFIYNENYGPNEGDLASDLDFSDLEEVKAFIGANYDEIVEIFNDDDLDNILYIINS